MLLPSEAGVPVALPQASLLSAVTPTLPPCVAGVQAGAKRNSFGRGLCSGFVPTSRACGTG